MKVRIRVEDRYLKGLRIALFPITLLLLGGSLFITFYIPYRIEYLPDPMGIRITLNLILPVEEEEFNERLTITPRCPWSRVKTQLKWLTPSTLEVIISEEGYVRGEEIVIGLRGVKIRNTPLKKWGTIKVRPRVDLQVIDISPATNCPTRGPVRIKFNSPVDPHTIHSISADVDGHFSPLMRDFRGKGYIDYTQWEFFPIERLENRRTYRIYIREGLQNMSGERLKEEVTLTFTTAAKPRPVSISPPPGSAGVRLYHPIEVEFDQPLKSGTISVTGMDGSTKVKGESLIFKEAYLFKPGHKYDVTVEAVAMTGEPGDTLTFSFTTMEMRDDALWVEVDLSGTHLVTVRRGTRPIKVMLASGGAPGRETPPGVYYIIDRGLRFFSYKYNEGAIFWVRFKGNYLFHSIPRDSNWRLKEEELDKLGGPASHGCVRLKDEDAQWFYENVPDGTMVIIHD